MGSPPDRIGPNVVFNFNGETTMDSTPDVEQVIIVFPSDDAAAEAAKKIHSFQLRTERGLSDTPMSLEESD